MDNINQHKKRRIISLEDDKKQSTRMEHLPNEIIHDILSRIPISSLVQFKCVCKAWSGLAQDPNHINLYKDPCLILHCDLPIRNQLYFLDFGAQKETKEKVRKLNYPFSSMMPEFEVVGSCNGLLCLADTLYNEAIYIYNPFSSKYLELPKSWKYPDQEVVFGFGFDPKTHSYKVVKIVYYRNGHSRARRLVYPQSQVLILTLGTTQWRSLGKISYQLVRRPAEALVAGKLHWVSRPRRYNPAHRIISLDLGSEQFLEVPRPDCGGLSRCNYHLLVVKGCLSAAVYCSYGRLEIWVMKEYNVKESWVKEFCVGSYKPKGLKQDNLERTLKIWKNSLKGKVVRVLGILKNGEILLEYKCRVLVTYDPNVGKFKDVMLQGAPILFQTVVHVGSLNWINNVNHG